MALSIRIGAVPGVLTSLELDDRATVADALAASGRTLGPRQHIEIIGVEGPVLPEDALIDDKTYVISGSAAAIEVSVSVGDAPARNTELQADAATVAHALHSAGVSCEGRALTVDGRPATVADLLSEGQHVRVGEDHLVVLVEIGRFRGNVALALGSTPIDALLAAGIDAEIPGFAVRAAGSAEFEPIEPDAALSYGCVLRTAEPPAAAATPGFTEAAARIAETIEGFLNGEGIEAALVQDADAEPHDAAPEASIDPVEHLVGLLDGTLDRIEAGIVEAEAAAASASATQTIYGLVEDGGDGSTSISWFRDKAVVDMLMDTQREDWDPAFGTNDDPETLVFPAGLDLEACGFSFSDGTHPLPA